MTQILSTETPALFNAAVERAAEVLRAGEPVALPTETVYGLAANALDAKAVARIYEIKGRPARNPIIVHVAGIDTARRCTAQWPDVAGKLAAAFWPGPLTMVLPRSKEIPDIVTAGGPTVGVRWPSHPFIQAVIRACGFPLAAPSANPSNAISPTNAAHVQKELGPKLRLIVDGGQAQVGIESTVVDLTSAPPRILRPGMIHEPALAAVVGEVSSSEFRVSRQEALPGPGMLRRHYAPKAKLLVLEWKNDAELRRQLETRNTKPETCHIVAHTRIPGGDGLGPVSVVPHDPEAFARALYAQLHQCDEAGAKCVVVEAPPGSGEWAAIADRLKRASAED